MEPEIRLVHRNEVVLVGGGRSEIHPAVATSLLEEPPHSRKMLLGVVRRELAFLVVRSAHLLEEDADRHVCDVGLGSRHD
jgi:hypothetical protein